MSRLADKVNAQAHAHLAAGEKAEAAVVAPPEVPSGVAGLMMFGALGVLLLQAIVKRRRKSEMEDSRGKWSHALIWPDPLILALSWNRLLAFRARGSRPGELHVAFELTNIRAMSASKELAGHRLELVLVDGSRVAFHVRSKRRAAEFVETYERLSGRVTT